MARWSPTVRPYGESALGGFLQSAQGGFLAGQQNKRANRTVTDMEKRTDIYAEAEKRRAEMEALQRALMAASGYNQYGLLLEPQNVGQASTQQAPKGAGTTLPNVGSMPTLQGESSEMELPFGSQGIVPGPVASNLAPGDARIRLPGGGSMVANPNQSPAALALEERAASERARQEAEIGRLAQLYGGIPGMDPTRAELMARGKEAFTPTWMEEGYGSQAEYLQGTESENLRNPAYMAEEFRAGVRGGDHPLHSSYREQPTEAGVGAARYLQEAAFSARANQYLQQTNPATGLPYTRQEAYNATVADFGGAILSPRDMATEATLGTQDADRLGRAFGTMGGNEAVTMFQDFRAKYGEAMSDDQVRDLVLQEVSRQGGDVEAADRALTRWFDLGSTNVMEQLKRQYAQDILE